MFRLENWYIKVSKYKPELIEEVDSDETDSETVEPPTSWNFTIEILKCLTSFISFDERRTLYLSKIRECCVFSYFTKTDEKFLAEVGVVNDGKFFFDFMADRLIRRWNKKDITYLPSKLF